ncbi:PREDICTED: uncharacterized protein LOC106106450 [Papilio polytes]|uniref:uncharacterized protein LOC106106450 n=1 Tax=Papilio polytes TaxID=76194 RepID=UPI000676927F|nr:PREDICTED: uncharacterized protein LOC106106450 [Papilio polytes]
MDLNCNYFKILLFVCFVQLSLSNNQVDAKNHSVMEKYIGEYYGKYDVQDYPQGLKNYTEVYELDKEREMPKLIIKKIGKHKKKWKKTEEKEKYIMMKKKKISKNKMKRKKPAKFVKTVNDKNKDSNMSGSKEVDDAGRKPDIVVHILK